MSAIQVFSGYSLNSGDSTVIQVVNADWIVRYGPASVTVTRMANTYTYSFQDTHSVIYTIGATSAETSGSGVTAGVSTAGNFTILNILLRQDSGIQKRWLVTLDNRQPSMFGITVQPIQSHLSSTIQVSQSTGPRIQVTFLPMFDFWDLTSTTFTIENVQENIGCATGSYNQLTRKVNEGVREIYVAFPLVTCYLAGKGNFSVDKIYSINKTVGLFWPQVFLYAQAKFILWRLMKSPFDMSIVLRKNTKEFLYNLKKSKYSNFLDYFLENSDLEKYFL